MNRLRCPLLVGVALVLAGGASGRVLTQVPPSAPATASAAPGTVATRSPEEGRPLLRASGEVVTLTSTGTPLGLMPGLMPFGELHFVLAPGDTLVLFSDGVPEAQNAADEELGEARLVECLRGAARQPASAIIDRIMTAIDTFAAGAPQFDDITLLVARRLP